MTHKCKVDPTHETDLYGCLDCFSEECLIEMFKDIEKEEK